MKRFIYVFKLLLYVITIFLVFNYLLPNGYSEGQLFYVSTFIIASVYISNILEHEANDYFICGIFFIFVAILVTLPSKDKSVFEVLTFQNSGLPQFQLTTGYGFVFSSIFIFLVNLNSSKSD